VLLRIVFPPFWLLLRLRGLNARSAVLRRDAAQGEGAIAAGQHDIDLIRARYRQAEEIQRQLDQDRGPNDE
jgi:hypothetical protein